MRNLVVFGVWFVAVAVAADEGLQIGVKAKVPMNGRPAITLKAGQAVVNAEIALTRSDGKTLALRSGKMRAGQEKELPFDQPGGRFHYEGTLKARYAANPDEEFTMPLSFDAVVSAPPKIVAAPQDVDIEGRRILVTMDHPAKLLKFTIYGDNGEVIDRGESNFENDPPGEKLPVVWNASEHQVLRIDIVGYDSDGYFSPTLQLFPWSLEIPHQDVNFATGESVIPAAELPKVQSALDEIQTAVKRYGKIVKIRLFVAGHTDTVGSVETNRVLSEARAQSIARAFRRAGIKVPILYQGFGEDDLKVATPDETDEPQNRRAAYILTVEEPRARGGTGSWKPLP